MWYTIKDLKTMWSGEIKNRRKDGSSYYVKGFIKPILDTNGDILEYISFRTDITAEIKIKEYFQLQLNISSNNFNSVLHLKKEYEKAVNSNNSILRTNLDNEVIFVNDNFLELLKYDKNYLYGKSFLEIIYEANPKNILKKISSTLKNKESYKNIINLKDSSNHKLWVQISIVPIKDLNENIIEYMYIFHDVTKIYTLHNEIEDTQREMLYKMSELAEQRSTETGNHIKRVAHYSALLAKLYGLDKKECDTIFTASSMHDIGKIAIPDDILKKPGKFTKEEFEVMKEHSYIGKKILQGSSRPIIQAAEIIAYSHHEKWNGKGYPLNLNGEDIPIYGRIVSIADVFDALCSIRYYKDAWPDSEVFELFKKESGKSFDPTLIKLFLNNKELFLEIREKFQ